MVIGFCLVVVGFKTALSTANAIHATTMSRIDDRSVAQRAADNEYRHCIGAIDALDLTPGSTGYWKVVSICNSMIFTN
jgi:hypothetical protein